MKNTKFFLIILFLGIAFCSFAQTTRVKGIVLNENKEIVPDVTISYLSQRIQSDANGYFEILIPTNKKVVVVFTHITLQPLAVTLNLKSDKVFVLNPVMSNYQEQLGAVTVTAKDKKRIQGIVTIDGELLSKIPGTNTGVENILKTLPGVNSNNELSTQYAVRGGNYDENLVYVNEIEVYRPFLIRSGQQEGLSFIHSDLVQHIDFSAGGFQAKYGDKLSSVLSITYRKPEKRKASFEASFLGGSLAIDAISKNKKWTAITGIRYRNNSLLVKSQETQTNYTPIFADIQTNINYQASAKWQWHFLGTLSQNKYQFQPLIRQTNFGTLDRPMALLVYYNGQEKDKYTTYFGAIKTSFKATSNFTLTAIGSVFHTVEQEYFDILAQYHLGEVDSSTGTETYSNVRYSKGIGSQLNHARNNLDALIANLELKGFHDWKTHQLEWGVKYTRESIRDRIIEWEVIDSAGFSISPPKNILPKKDEPYFIYTGPLLPYQHVRATNFNTINRVSGFAQWNVKSNIGSNLIWYNAGVRFHNWTVLSESERGKSQLVFSPRVQISIQPDWKKNMIFRFSTGIYQQPPFYRELRDAAGVVQPNVKSQQSIHWVLGNDYSFKMWNRPFRLISELYYKWMTDVNTYTIDNIRIRYAANTIAKAYAQGLDIRLNGEFVPGIESWFSFGYLKTEENSNNQGFIARPTDQRLKFGLLFQDYMPNMPSMKVYLNLIYNTGLPGGTPSYSDPYLYQNRLQDYRRADIGFSKVFVKDQNKWLGTFDELIFGLEIFNLFNNQNAITNTWVRDVYTKNEYGIPNYMTTRIFNLKLSVKL